MFNNLSVKKKFSNKNKCPSLILQLSIVMVFIYTISCSNNPIIKYSNIKSTVAREDTQPRDRKPSAEGEKNWKTFLAAPERSGDNLSVHWNPSTKTPKAIFGKITNPLGEVSEKTALEFLSKNKELFKFSNDLSDLTLVGSTETPTGKHFSFKQNYNGVYEVYKGQVGVHFNQKAEIIAINNTYIPNIALDLTAAVISQETAKTLAKAILKQSKSIQVGETNINIGTSPIVYIHSQSTHLAWRVVISTPNNTWETFIDAQNKEILLEDLIDLNQYFVEGKGKIFNVNPVVATRNCRIDPNNIPPDAYKENVLLKGLLGTGFLEGEYASSQKTSRRIRRPNNDFVFLHDKDGFLETMAYFYIDYTQRYIQETLGFNNVNNRPIEFNAKLSNALGSFYDPNTKTLSFGSGEKPAAKDAEIIVHEYGHAILDNQIPGFGLRGESKAIIEGFGDYLAASLCSHFSGGFGDACIGEWDANTIRCRQTPLCLRRLDTNKIYPNDYNENSPHSSGEIWSSTLWEISKLIGKINTDKIVIGSHFINKDNPTAGFDEFADAILLTALTLQSQGKIDEEIVSKIREVLKKRGFSIN